MKFSTLASLAAVVVGASAGVTDGLPSCAKDCVNQYVGAGSTTIAGCKALDVACVCSNKNFISDLSCCLADACGPADQKAAVEFAAQICSSAGVMTPSEVVCNKNPANATSTAGPTAGGGGSKPAPNTTATAGSTKPTSGAASVLAGAGGFFGAAAVAALMLAM